MRNATNKKNVFVWRLGKERVRKVVDLLGLVVAGNGGTIGFAGY